ncbi:MAG: ABC transporter ATP-binding protein [Brevinematales bacterium]|nr:ABC transporter ATP-binding protein [Brevinematales bacterium]
MSFVVLDNISKWYLESNGSKVVVFRNFSLSVEKGKFVSVVGESGSGKTTLLNIIGAIDSVSEGSVYVNGVNITNMDEDGLSEFRNTKVGYVFQNHFLLKGFTVLENVIIPVMLKSSYNRIKVLNRAKELLDFLGIGDKIHRNIDEISGGERQRVSIARALINDPDIIIADEPTGNLDPKNSEIVFSLFYNLVKSMGKTCIMATHNMFLSQQTDYVINLDFNRS